ncbi:pentatricopeptide repeat-containing protein At4g20770 [Lycium barbarum]|uniref:pentatricopeptide repeat-containing protein At4g20770 n=1 Tax=Lycium barbarum TaxID=112863 RepID=UPI00293E30F7|nr:pentatricopeptide repeat-containing protein At4g20770 [Lycium barbarum]XP_060178415.1 pentatricopeptide repeat-containing protein At4g20770 [Lycium barbarum]XP_060178416.1 pentatricopeptide repeat-containing protein At4g20770 [Lycium barbarum]
MHGRINTTYLVNLLQTSIDNKAYLAGKLLHAHILRVGLSADTFLLNRLIELYSKCGRIQAARHLFDQMVGRNIYSWHSLLSAYCKEGQLDNAHNLFMKMPERNSVSWNTVISAFARNGYERKALEVYSLMNAHGFSPTHITLASVLSACGGLAELECGRVSHASAVKYGLHKNVYVGNALLSLYVKCGCPLDALIVFRELDDPNEVSFTAMMCGLVETDQVEEAFEMFRLMQRSGIRIDSVSLSSVLKVCAKGRGSYFGWNGETDGDLPNTQGNQVHSLTIKLGFEGDLHVSNSLLDMYAKNGDMESAEVLFGNLSETSTVSWNVMISGFGQNHDKERAMEYMEKMRGFGGEPDQVTYINMLAACVKSGDVENGRLIFDSMACPSLISWNAILSGYSQNGDHLEALKLFREMQFQSQRPDRTTLAIMLSSCSEMGFLECGVQIHATSLKCVSPGDIYIASGLIGMYLKCGRVEAAVRIFDGLTEADIVCWNSLITGLSYNSLDKEAFTFFKRMLQWGLLPNEFSFATTLSCCTKLSSLSQGRQVHGLISKGGYANDVVVGSTLIDMYSKCGDVDGARIHFDMMPYKNTITWNEMIHGYAQNGRGDEAIFLYEDMIYSGEKPDVITFIAALTACSHSGLVDLGLKIFSSMQQEYGLEPLVDHYTCIIDCLGRAARFSEIEELIDEMPCKDDSVVWEVLLSSCRLHGNVILARRAAEELIRLNPQNSAPYVLLANMYTSLGRWDETEEIRAAMLKRQATKDPGFSWG